MASGRLIDYLGVGPVASRPATPVLHPDTLGVWFDPATGTASGWDGTAWTDFSGAGISNPMTTAGDLILGGVAGAPGRLAAGSAAQVLTVVAGVPAWAAAASTTYTGTAGSITLTGSAFSIDAAYVGQASITTLGTIATGAWNGTSIGPTYGGTGLTSYAAGDVLYASATNTLASLAAGSNGQVLTLAAGLPVWQTVAGGFTNPMTTTGDLIYSSSGSTPARLGATTNGYVLTLVAGVPAWAAATGGGTYTGTAGSITLTGSAFSIAAAYSGQTTITKVGTVATGVWSATAITAAKGGTGQTVYAVGDILYASSTTALSKLTAGTSGYVLTSGGAGVAPAWAAGGGGGGGVTGFTTSLVTSAPNATINVSAITASGGTSNQHAVLQPKGTGGIAANVADSLTSGGDARGASSVDWQTSRNNSDQVASGANSGVLYGIQNKATGSQSGAMGRACSASGTDSFAMGWKTEATGGQSLSMGDSTQARASCSVALGLNTIADGLYGIAAGGSSSNRGVQSSFSMGVAYFTGFNVGDAQSQRFVLAAKTSTATSEALTADASGTAGASTTNQVLLTNNSAYIVKGLVVARQNTTGDSKSWEFTAHIKRGASAGSTVMVAAATVTTIANDSGAAAWTIAVTADTTNGAMRVTGTGEAAKSINWMCDVYSCAQIVG